MKHFPIALLALLEVFLFVPLTAQEGTEAIPSNPMAGRIIFEEKGCIGCHAINGFGGSVGPDFGKETFYGSFYDLAAKLWNHAPQMDIQTGTANKDWVKLTKSDLDNLISYLFFLRYLGEPGNVSTGRKLISSKSCLACHKIGSEGKASGRALDKLKVYASPLYMAQTIWNHGPGMQQKMKKMGIKLPQFDDGDITDISAFIREASRSQSTMEKQFMSPGNPQVGETLFKTKKCISCHAVGEDQPTVGNRLGEMDLHRSVTSIAGTMWNHVDQMSEAMKKANFEWPRFKDSEMADLIAYLYFFGYQGNPGDEKKGAEIFESKACSSCHGAGKKHTFKNKVQLGTPTDLIVVMWNHVPLMHKLIVAKNIQWPKLSDDELRHLYAFLKGYSE